MPHQYTTRSGITLSRDSFIAHYVAAWLAANSVHHYWNGNAPHCADNPPVEDALCCAEAAWEQIETIQP